MNRASPFFKRTNKLTIQGNVPLRAECHCGSKVIQKMSEKSYKKAVGKTETLWRTNYCLAGYLFLVIFQKLGCVVKCHSFCKKCLHDLQFKKTRYSSPNLSKLARADINCQFMKTRSLCRHCLQNEWTLDS